MTSQQGQSEVGKTIREARLQKGMSLRDVTRAVEHSKLAGTTVSPSYLSQVENGTNDVLPEKISFDFFWAVAVVLELDPVALFVMSRPKIFQAMRDPSYRRKIFPA